MVLGSIKGMNSCRTVLRNVEAITSPVESRAETPGLHFWSMRSAKSIHFSPASLLSAIRKTGFYESADYQGWLYPLGLSGMALSSSKTERLSPCYKVYASIPYVAST
ncbi:hypothetical protein KP509_20G078400 [Ceratopteris richardii]|uniref:Uncharacterized protein n=1 Tax=Ceratopteris richardii TaxID=49495 RepID=A0A8T2SK42_CERRI|nr:hypothetical protein KP509_20G078400 [Ceratopteris richardii]